MLVLTFSLWNAFINKEKASSECVKQQMNRSMEILAPPSNRRRSSSLLVTFTVTPLSILPRAANQPSYTARVGGRDALIVALRSSKSSACSRHVSAA